jgi:heterotetrameric sarcosine oxidase gamma subunit
MADPLARRDVLADLAATARAGEAVTLTALPPAERLAVHAASEALERLGKALGADLAGAHLRATTTGGRTALRLGPDEWLVVGPAGDADGLATAAEGLLASVVDVSHRQAAIEVDGPRAVDAISAFCALDLDLAAFPVGMVTRTVFGRAGIVLWRTAEAVFRIEVTRSFAPYVWACLEEARREFLD